MNDLTYGHVFANAMTGNVVSSAFTITRDGKRSCRISRPCLCSLPCRCSLSTLLP